MEKAQGINVSNVRLIDNSQNKGNLKGSNKDCNISANNRNYCVDVDSTVLDNCPNTPLTPVGISTGVIAKIPVVLAELTIRFNVGASINLPEPALEVKDTKKKLKITQCMLLQPTNILFIKGFVRKSIDYTTGVCSNWKGVCGELHHCTVDVPFECSTPVDFFIPPETVIVNSNSEFEYFKVSNLPNKHFAEKDNLLSGDLSEINQIRTEFFNELPFCDLISASIFEFDEFIGRERPHNADLPFEEKFFRKLEEKMVIELTLKVLQNRQVEIPAIAGTGSSLCNTLNAQ